MTHVKSKIAGIDISAHLKLIETLPEELKTLIYSADQKEPEHLSKFKMFLDNLPALKTNFVLLLVDGMKNKGGEYTDKEVEDMKLLYLFLEDMEEELKN